MLRQLLNHSEDIDWQRIHWRFLPTDDVDDFRLITVTYGERPAPFLSNACILELAIIVQEIFSSEAKFLCKGCYVDDFNAVADSLEEALIVREKLISAIFSAGLEVCR